LLRTYDPGGDSTAACDKDVYGEVLNYYQGDFNRIGSVLNSIGNLLNLHRYMVCFPQGWCQVKYCVSTFNIY